MPRAHAVAGIESVESIVPDEHEAADVGELLDKVSELRNTLAVEEGDYEVIDTFVETFRALDVNNNPADKAACDELEKTYGEDVLNVVYSAYKSGIKQCLAPVLMYAGQAKTNPKIKAALHMYMKGRSARDYGDFMDEYTHYSGGDRAVGSELFSNIPSHAETLRFSEFVAGVDLNSDKPLEQTDEEMNGYWHNRLKGLNATLRSVGTKDEDDLDVWRPAGRNFDPAVFEGWDAQVQKSLANGNTEEMLDATSPDVYRMKGFFTLNHRQYKSAQFIQTAKAWFQHNDKPVEVEIPSITLKTAKYLKDTQDYKQFSAGRELFLDPRAFVPVEIPVFNFSPKTREEVEVFALQLKSAQKLGKTVRIPVGPPPNWLVLEEAKYQQVVEVVAQSVASFERRGVKPEPEKVEELYTKLFAEKVTKTEFAADGELLTKRMWEADDGYHKLIQRYEKEGNAERAKEYKYYSVGIRESIRGVNGFYEDVSRIYGNEKGYRRLAEERAREMATGLGAGTFKWKLLVEEKLAGIKLEYAYKAMVLSRVRQNVELFMSQNHTPEEIRAFWLNLDYEIEIRFRAFIVADLEGTDVDAAFDKVKATLEPFSRLPYETYHGASKLEANVQKITTDSPDLLAKIDLITSDNVKSYNENLDPALFDRAKDKFKQELADLQNYISRADISSIEAAKEELLKLRETMVTGYGEDGRSHLHMLAGKAGDYSDRAERVAVRLFDYKMRGVISDPDYVIGDLVAAYAPPKSESQ